MREKLQARIQKLQTERDQALANVNAYSGAIQVLQQLLDEENSASSNGSEVTSGVSTSDSSKG